MCWRNMIPVTVTVVSNKRDSPSTYHLLLRGMQGVMYLLPDFFGGEHPVLICILLQKPFKIPVIDIVFHFSWSLRIRLFYLRATAASQPMESASALGFCKILFLTRISSSMALARVYWLRLVLSSISSIWAISR